MSLGGSLHEIKFNKCKDSDADKSKSEQKKESKKEYRIMLKRQALKEMMIDSDFDHKGGFSMFSMSDG